MADTPLPKPTLAKIDSKDNSGHYWMIQQGKEFWFEENENRPDFTSAPGEPKKTNRGAFRNGAIGDKLADRMIKFDKLSPRK